MGFKAGYLYNFKELHKHNLALTFDDISLRPSGSEVVPGESTVNTKLTANIPLKIPFVSAPMDTVTGYKLARAMAQHGGIGILHRNYSIDEQVAKVKQVKRYESFMIENPETIGSNDSLADAWKLIHTYSGIPVVDNGLLVGLLTKRDIPEFAPLENLKVKDAMTPKEKLITANPGISADECQKILYENRIERLPVVDSSGKLAGLITKKDMRKKRDFPNATRDKQGRLRVGAAIGPGDDERVKKLVKADVDFICIDTAQGHHKDVVSYTKKLRSEYPDLNIIAGNVATYDGAKALCEAGADTVRVGVGSGAICTTRIVMAVGIPQISAVYESATAAKEFQEQQGKEVHVIADGGIRQIGDAIKALAAGASAVMMGNILSGTAESLGQTIYLGGRHFKTYRGMGSEGAIKAGSVRYGENADVVAEGVEGQVLYKGPLKDTLFQYTEGLKRSMGKYLGARTIKELNWGPNFIIQTLAGVRESHPHDVHITKESRSYMST